MNDNFNLIIYDMFDIKKNDHFSEQLVKSKINKDGVIIYHFIFENQLEILKENSFNDIEIKIHELNTFKICFKSKINF